MKYKEFKNMTNIEKEKFRDNIFQWVCLIALICIVFIMIVGSIIFAIYLLSHL